MIHAFGAVLASLAILVPAARATPPQAAKGVERALSASPVAAGALAEAPELPAARVAQAGQASPKVRALRVSLELTGVCRGMPLMVPGWCPAPDQAVVEADGGVTVTRDTLVELELTVPILWAVGPHAFMIVPAAATEEQYKEPAMGEVVHFGVPGTRTTRFRAGAAGEYRFLDPFGHALMGRLTVK